MMLALSLWLLAATPDVVPSEAPGVVAPDTTLTQKDVAYRLGKNLRCPVCQGMSIAESPSTMAQDMMKRVRGMVKDGKSESEVYGYFIARYGEWVMLDPPSHGFSVWVWVLPPLFVAGAGLLLVRWVRRLRGGGKPDDATPEPKRDDRKEDTTDAYLQAIRDEVQR